VNRLATLSLDAPEAWDLPPTLYLRGAPHSVLMDRPWIMGPVPSGAPSARGWTWAWWAEPPN
jgi:hypothetical protein